MHGDGTGSIDDPTLAEALRDGPLTLDDAVRTASAVADAVAALHASGRAHGGFGPEDVAMGARVALVGPDAPKSRLAAPPSLRARDLEGVGRVLSAALGWPEGDQPAAVTELVRRAERSDAPAAALADALHRLLRDPLALPGLLPPRREPASARRPLAGLVPRPDRRAAGVAAVAVAGAAALGAVLLLLGAPVGTARPPLAAAVERSAATVEPQSEDAVVAAAPSAIPPAPRPSGTRTPAPAAAPRAARPGAVAAPDRAAASAARPFVADATPTGSPSTGTRPTPRPTSTPMPTARPTAPSPSAPPPSPAPPAPTAKPTAAPPVTSPPSPAPSSDAPASSVAPTPVR